MASYTRRIDRPGGWELEPFMTWVDATTIRSGNPLLKPEYIDSYEIGSQSFLLGIPLNAEVYYRKTHNRIEGVRSVFAQNVTLHTFENVGTDGSLGVEAMATVDAWNWWDMQVIGNLFRYEVDATLFGESVQRSNVEWRGRVNSMFSVTRTTRFEFNVQARSGSIGAQQEEKGFVTADLGIRQQLFSNRLSLTLQVRDLFGSVRREEITRAADFIRREVRHRDAPLVFLNLRLNLGRQNEEDSEREEEEQRFDVEN
jgi:outer membrane receptor protein involved in Fe transport